MAIPAILSGIGKSVLGGGKAVVKSGLGKEGAKALGGAIVKGGGDGGEAPPRSQSSIVRAPNLNIEKFIDKDAVEEVDVDVKDPEVDPLEKALKGLTAIAYTLQDTVKDKTQVEKDKKKYAEKRRLRLSRMLRGVGGAIGSATGFVKNMTKKIPFLDRIKNFFMNVLLGAVFTFLLTNIEKIIEAVETLVQKFKEFKEKFDELMGFLNENLFQPIMSVAKAIIGPIANLMAKFMGVPDYEADKNTIMQNITAISKEIPILGDVVRSIENAVDGLLGQINKKTGENIQRGSGSSYDYDTSSGGLLAPGAVSMGTEAQSQVSAAGFSTSEFALYRDVVAQIESGGEYDIQGGSGNMYSGRYQMGAAARQDAARLLGETYQGDTEAARRAFRADPEMQERYFAAYTRANHEYLMAGSPEYRDLSKEGKLQVLGYAHNAGWSRAAEWLKSGMSDSFRDGFGTRSDEYSTSIRQAQERRRAGEVTAPSLREPLIPQSALPALPPTGTLGTGAQMYGAARDGGRRKHAGQDFDAGPNGTFYSRIGGEVIYAANAGGGYGNVVDVYNAELGVTERIAEGDVNLVKKGDIIKQGTPVQRGTAQTGVFHYEIRKGRAGASGSFEGTLNPLEFLNNLPAQIESPESPDRGQNVSRTTSYETSDHVAVVPIPTSPTSVSSSGGGAPSVASAGTGTNELNRRQQHDYLQFLYKA